MFLPVFVRRICSRRFPFTTFVRHSSTIPHTNVPNKDERNVLHKELKRSFRFTVGIYFSITSLLAFLAFSYNYARRAKKRLNKHENGSVNSGVFKGTRNQQLIQDLFLDNPAVANLMYDTLNKFIIPNASKIADELLGEYEEPVSISLRFLDKMLDTDHIVTGAGWAFLTDDEDWHWYPQLSIRSTLHYDIDVNTGSKKVPATVLVQACVMGGCNKMKPLRVYVCPKDERLIAALQENGYTDRCLIEYEATHQPRFFLFFNA